MGSRGWVWGVVALGGLGEWYRWLEGRKGGGVEGRGWRAFVGGGLWDGVYGMGVYGIGGGVWE